MKFRKFGQAMLAAVVSAGIVLGLTSCTSSFTVAYFYVIGQQYNQIAGYRVNNNNGKLTSIGSAVSTGGTAPIRALILPAGKFVYVLNQGAKASDGTVTGAGVTRFIIGQRGILTEQDGLVATQGASNSQPFRMASDSSGSYLFVLDAVAPTSSICPTTTSCSAVTVFKIDANTGRLTTVVNQQQTDTSVNPAVNLTYFPVATNAVDMALVGSNLYIASDNGDGNQKVTAYTVSSGQITATTTGTQSVAATHINAIIGGYSSSNAIGSASSYIYILDRGVLDSTGAYSKSQVYVYTAGTGGALSSVTGSPKAQVATVNNPNFLLVENGKKVVYVSNGGDAGGTNTNTGAGYITAYLVTSSGTDVGSLTDQTDSPFTTESNPRCLVEDPSNQYIYSIDYGANNISLKRLDTTYYNLAAPRTTATYTTVNQPTWGVMTNRTQ
jgi:6-phosphogluconolactonase (cycloisomerase 2 family)